MNAVVITFDDYMKQVKEKEGKNVRIKKEKDFKEKCFISTGCPLKNVAKALFCT